MRNHEYRFEPQLGKAGKSFQPQRNLRVPGALILVTCGMILVCAVWADRSAKAETSGASTPGSPPAQNNSSLVVSQEIARMYLASTRLPKPWTNFVGDAACLPCHKDKVDSYHLTAHFVDSSWPTKDSIHGSFRAGSNVLLTGNTNLSFRMDADAKGFFQSAVLRVSPTEVTQYTARMDVVFGSGRKAQTYLNWRGDRLFELPVSYWAGKGIWMNSPSLQLYADGTANFGRGITPRCLECHTTSFEWLDPFAQADTGTIPFNRYTNLVLGITCEKCHGPGGEHVALFRSSTPPKAPSAMAIVNPARLSRDRQMDTCALCHAGAGNELTPAQAYQPGDELSRDLEIQTPGPDTPVDVHGNQIQGLKRSRCYQSPFSARLVQRKTHCW